MKGDRVGGMRRNEIGPLGFAFEIYLDMVPKHQRLVALSGAVCMNVIDMMLKFLAV